VNRRSAGRASNQTNAPHRRFEKALHQPPISARSSGCPVRNERVDREDATRSVIARPSRFKRQALEAIGGFRRDQDLLADDSTWAHLLSSKATRFKLVLSSCLGHSRRRKDLQRFYGQQTEVGANVSHSPSDQHRDLLMQGNSVAILDAGRFSRGRRCGLAAFVWGIAARLAMSAGS